MLLENPSGSSTISATAPPLAGGLGSDDGGHPQFSGVRLETRIRACRSPPSHVYRPRAIGALGARPAIAAKSLVARDLATPCFVHVICKRCIGNRRQVP